MPPSPPPEEEEELVSAFSPVLLGIRRAKLEEPCVSRYQDMGPKCAGVWNVEGMKITVGFFWEVGRGYERPSVACSGFMVGRGGVVNRSCCGEFWELDGWVVFGGWLRCGKGLYGGEGEGGTWCCGISIYSCN